MMMVSTGAEASSLSSVNKRSGGGGVSQPSTMSRMQSTTSAMDCSGSAVEYYSCGSSFSEGKTENENGDGSSGIGSTFFCLYLPVICMWLRRCTFGAANLFQSLVVGHCLRLLIGNFSEWAPSWLQTLVLKQPSNGRIDPHAWPPPALVVLALLTIFVLVVHPDGFTWILLGKARDSTRSIFSTTAHLWAMMVQDFGVIPTIAASTTIAALVFLLFVVIKTLSPRKQKSVSTLPEKKKKKRRGNTRHRGSGGGSKINQTAGGTNRSVPNSCESIKRLEISSTPRTTTTKAPDSIPLTPMELVDKPISSYSAKIPDEATAPSISVPDKANFKENERIRGSSVSTLDTTTLSDDQSCGSTSVLSVPSVNTNSSRKNGTDQESQHSKVKPHSTGNRRQKRIGKPTKTDRNPQQANSKLSRWDALKPNQQSLPKQNSYHQSQSQQSPFHTSSHSQYRNKRRGVGGGQKKGRQQLHSTSSQTASIVSSSRSHIRASDSVSQFRTKHVARLHAPSENEKTMSDSNAMLGRLPAPPPGLGPFPTPTEVSEKKSSNSDFVPLSLLQTTLQSGSESIDPVFSSLLNNPSSRRQEWQERITSTPPIPQYSLDSATSYAGQYSSQQHSSYMKENPFAESNDSQIEAQLQELGGQMAGSILDF